MTPSRELDALVAEKVMGFGWAANKVARSDSPQGSRFPVGFDFLVPNPGNKLEWKKATGKKARESTYFVPYYSTDIAVAWTVVDRMLKMGFSEWLISDDEVYFQRGRLNGNSMKQTADYAFGCHGNAPGKTPEAICLAALKALGAMP